MNTCKSCHKRIASMLEPALCGKCKDKIRKLLTSLSPRQIAQGDEGLLKEVERLNAK